MTFLEKAMEIENETEKGLKREEVIQRYCPSSYDLEAGNGCSMSALEKCRICWNREMPNTELVKTVTLPMPPNTEPKEDKPFTEKEVYEEAGYNKGLNDAWEFIKNLWSIVSDSVKMELFGTIFVTDILKNFTPQEALAKLKAYEEAQIEVGDVVTTVNGECPYIVTNVQLPNTLHVINSRNGYAQQIRIDVCKKTGKHLNVQQFLKQIGE